MSGLAQDLALLAHAGGRSSVHDLDVALAGAATVDLIRAGLLLLGPFQPGGRTRLQSVGYQPTGDPVCDAVLQAVTERGDRSVSAYLARPGKAAKQLHDVLVGQGLLVAEHHTSMLVFGVTRYQTVDGTWARDVLARMNDCVRAGGATPDDRVRALVAVVGATGSIPRMLGQTGIPVKAQRDLVRQMVTADPVAAGVRRVVADRQQAVSAAGSSSPSSSGSA